MPITFIDLNWLLVTQHNQIPNFQQTPFLCRSETGAVSETSERTNGERKRQKSLQSSKSHQIPLWWSFGLKKETRLFQKVHSKTQRDQRAVWTKCQKFIPHSQCGKDGMICPVTAGFWDLSLYLTVPCSRSSRAPPTVLLTLPWKQLADRSLIRLTGHPDPGNVGADAQLPDQKLGPLSPGVGGGGGWVGRGAGRGVAGGVVWEKEEVRKPRLLMGLVLWRQTRGVTLGSSHDLNINDYYKCYVKRTE